MKRDLLIALFLSAFFHAAILFGERLFQKKKTEDFLTTTVEVNLFTENKQEEEKEEEPPEVVEGDVEFLPEEFMAASIGEPPPSAVALGSLVMTVRADKPRPPRPEGLQRFTVPTTSQTGQGAAGIQQLDIFDVSELDQKPNWRIPPNLQYPFNLKRTGTTGSVVARWTCDEKGNVINVQIISSTHREFEQATISALSRGKMTPGLRKGKPVKFAVQQTFDFNMTN